MRPGESSRHQGGAARTGGDVVGDDECDDEDEDRVKDETRATLRCYPLEQDSVDGLTCPLTGKPAREWAYFARAY